MYSCRKTRYCSEQEILKHIKNTKNGPKYHYLCKCGAWHLSGRRPIEVMEKELEDLKYTIKQLNSKETIISPDPNYENLKQAYSKANKTISRLRLDNSELITKNILLENKINENRHKNACFVKAEALSGNSKLFRIKRFLHKVLRRIYSGGMD